MNFRERYKFDPKTDLIGKGGFSKVYKAHDAIRRRDVALKFYNGTWSEKYDIIGEIIRMGDLVHSNIIRYYDATIIESTNAIGEVEQIQVGIMEYANAGDITKLFKDKPQATIKLVIKGILEGLRYLHEQEIAHRDMKPKNILLHKDEKDTLLPKIADFGISKKMNVSESASTQLLGSIEYMAPEQFNPTKYGTNGKAQTNLDLWSLGIIIYELFTQNTPFGNRSTGLSNEEILSNILFKDIIIEYGRLEEPYQTMVRRCLVKDATKRVQTAQELLDILEKKISVEVVKENIDLNATQILSKPILEKTLEQRPKKEEIQIIKATPPKPKPQEVVEPKATQVIPKKVEKPIPEPPKPTYAQPNTQAAKHIEVGKSYFKERNYVESYKYLSPYEYALEFDSEAKFFLGFMLYNGKCGGAHDFVKGKRLMDEAKKENRPLIGQLLLKYVMKK